MALISKIECGRSSIVRIFLLALHISYVCALFTKPTLYTDKDHVTLLNVTNFKSIVHDTDTAWAVEFYNSWCGHCVRFAPEWIKVARDVKAWSPVIGVAAIDCAVEENVKVCQNYAVSAFPTIKFFTSKSSETETNKLGQTYRDKKEIEAIRRAIIDFLTLKNPQPPSSWPDLHPISYLDMNSLWKDIPISINHVAIVIEPTTSFLGREVILDALPLANHIRVLRAIKDRAPLLENFKEMPATFLVLASRTGDIKTYVDADESRNGYIQYLEEFAKEKLKWKAEVSTGQAIVSDKQPPNKTSTSLSSSSEVNFFVDMDKVYLQDIENALHYTFWQEVMLKERIEGDQLAALRMFVFTLAKYLPGTEQTKSFLNKLKAWLEQPTSSQITADQLKQKLEEIQSSLSSPVKTNEWVGCKGSLPYLRGYPCSLWVTFHTLTVSAFLKNGKGLDVDFNPLEVLLAIRGYVINFFSCRTCVEHFSNMSSNLSNEVNTPEDSVLWLWQAHNKVNMRLKEDETEDQAHPKVQFPGEMLCSNCRSTADSQWDLVAVLDFLLSHYAEQEIMATEEIGKESDKGDNEKDDIKPDVRKTGDIKKRETHKKPLALVVEKESPIEQPSILTKWGFGNADISLCILLYVSSILLLLVCYFYVLTRRRSLLNSIKRRTLHYFA